MVMDLIFWGYVYEPKFPFNLLLGISNPAQAWGSFALYLILSNTYEFVYVSWIMLH